MKRCMYKMKKRRNWKNQRIKECIKELIKSIKWRKENERRVSENIK